MYLTSGVAAISKICTSLVWWTAPVKEHLTSIQRLRLAVLQSSHNLLMLIQWSRLDCPPPSRHQLVHLVLWAHWSLRIVAKQLIVVFIPNLAVHSLVFALSSRLDDALVIVVGQLSDNRSLWVQVDILPWKFIYRFCFGRLTQYICQERH